MHRLAWSLAFLVHGGGCRCGTTAGAASGYRCRTTAGDEVAYCAPDHGYCSAIILSDSELSPDDMGTYTYMQQHDGRPAYHRSSSGKFLYWNRWSAQWMVGNQLGDDGSDSRSRTSGTAVDTQSVTILSDDVGDLAHGPLLVTNWMSKSTMLGTEDPEEWIDDSGLRARCVPSAVCDAHACAPTHVLKANAGLYCAGATCNADDDQATCCAPRAACDAMACAPTHVLKADHAGLLCARSTCEPVPDQATCCDEATYVIKLTVPASKDAPSFDECLEYNVGTGNAYATAGCNGGTNQKWRWTASGQLQTTHRELHASGVHIPAPCLDYSCDDVDYRPYGAYFPSGNAYMNECGKKTSSCSAEGTNQQWSTSMYPSDQSLGSMYDGRCLDRNSGNERLKVAGNVIVSKCDGGWNQQWKFVLVATGCSYETVPGYIDDAHYALSGPFTEALHGCEARCCSEEQCTGFDFNGKSGSGTAYCYLKQKFEGALPPVTNDGKSWSHYRKKGSTSGGKRLLTGSLFV